MADFLDRKTLHVRLQHLMGNHGIGKIDDVDGLCDEMIDAVVDAHAQAAVSKGMDFARGLLAKRAGKEGGE